MTDLVQPLNGGNFIHQEGPGSACSSLLDRFSLRGKTAVVTGAGGGIGLSVAQAFAELGANVAIWYNSNESAHDRAKEISEKYSVKCKCRILRPQTIGAIFSLRRNRQGIQSQHQRLFVG
jgi:sorbose reductase